MKFYEMINSFPRNHNHKRITPYLEHHNIMRSIIYNSNREERAMFLTGLDTVIHCLQMYGMPDDIGDLLK